MPLAAKCGAGPFEPTDVSPRQSGAVVRSAHGVRRWVRTARRPAGQSDRSAINGGACPGRRVRAVWLDIFHVARLLLDSLQPHPQEWKRIEVKASVASQVGVPVDRDVSDRVALPDEERPGAQVGLQEREGLTTFVTAADSVGIISLKTTREETNRRPPIIGITSVCS